MHLIEGSTSLQVVQAFVRKSMGYIEQTPDKDSKLELIKTLQTVTEGKVMPPSWSHPGFVHCTDAYFDTETSTSLSKISAFTSTVLVY